MSMARQSSAWVDVTEENGTLVLRLHGELDMASRKAIEPVVMAAVTTVGSVTLDLAELTFCDSSGLAILITASRKVEANGSSIAVCNMRPPVRRAFEIAGLGDLIPVVE
jgi:anti-sigma B factor antagonist